MTSDLKSATLITLVIHMHIVFNSHGDLRGHGGLQTLRTDLTSKFNPVTSITHVTMLFWPLTVTIHQIFPEEEEEGYQL